MNQRPFQLIRALFGDLKFPKISGCKSGFESEFCRVSIYGSYIIYNSNSAFGLLTPGFMWWRALQCLSLPQVHIVYVTYIFWLHIRLAVNWDLFYSSKTQEEWQVRCRKCKINQWYAYLYASMYRQLFRKNARIVLTGQASRISGVMRFAVTKVPSAALRNPEVEMSRPWCKQTEKISSLTRFDPAPVHLNWIDFAVELR